MEPTSILTISPSFNLLSEGMPCTTSSSIDIHKVLGKPYNAHSGINAYQTPPPPSDRAYQTFCGT